MSAIDRDLDRMLDVLLREAVGGESPPDLSARIRSAVARRIWIPRAALAAAGIVVVAVAGILLGGPGYPDPVFSGDYALEEGGAVVVARGPASVDLGGYARIDLAPGTRVRLAGEPRAEAIELVQGSIECQVESDAGTFEVSTPLGVVHVTGTRFLVEYVQETRDGGGEMFQDRLVVKVLVGAVLLVSGGREVALAQGDEEKRGTFRGVVAEVGDNWFRVEGEGGKSMRFMPRWIGGMPADGGGLDKEMLKKIHELMAGDKVVVQWEWEERARAIRIEVVEPAPRKGVFHGVVREKGENWFRVEGEGGKSMRFAPRWIGGMPADGGGFDKKMLEIFARLKVGQKVRVRWEYEERPRAVEVALER